MRNFRAVEREKNISRHMATIRKADHMAFFDSADSGCIAWDESSRFVHLEPAEEDYSEASQMMSEISRIKKGQIPSVFQFCQEQSHGGRVRGGAAA